MDPIISPTWIYLAHVAGTIYGLSIFVLFVSVVALLLLGVEFVADPDSAPEKELTIKGVKICIVAIIVCTLMLILTPDKKTMYAMIAASIITPDNISGVEEHVVDLIAKIADAVYNTTK